MKKLVVITILGLITQTNPQTQNIPYNQTKTEGDVTRSILLTKQEIETRARNNKNVDINREKTAAYNLVNKTYYFNQFTTSICDGSVDPDTAKKDPKYLDSYTNTSSNQYCVLFLREKGLNYAQAAKALNKIKNNQDLSQEDKKNKYTNLAKQSNHILIECGTFRIQSLQEGIEPIETTDDGCTIYLYTEPQQK